MCVSLLDAGQGTCRMCPVRRLAILLLTLLAAGSGWAQPRQSPPPPPRKMQFDPRPAAPVGISPQKGEDLLDDFRPWLVSGKPRQKASDVDPKQLQELMKKLNKDKDVDPKQLEKLMREHPELQDKEFVKQLEKMLQDPEFMKSLEGKLQHNEGQPINEKEAIDEKIKEAIKSSQEHGNPNGIEPPKIDPNDPNSPKDPNSESGKDPAADNEWVKWMEKNFGDSPGTQDAIKDLVAAMKNDGGKGLFDDIPELKNGGWKDLENWGKSNGGDKWNFKPPDMHTGSGPKLGGTGGGSSFGGGGGGSHSFGGGGGGGGPELGGGVTSLAIIAGIVGALILAVILFRKWKLTHAERMAQAAYAKGGIDFDAIRSREELVRVFEAVSLDQHGEEARNWNHRVIAEQFRSQPAKADPADEAADLYERARYAPADEDLTTNEFADARRDLRAIAGVPT